MADASTTWVNDKKVEASGVEEEECVLVMNTCSIKFSHQKSQINVATYNRNNGYVFLTKGIDFVSVIYSSYTTNVYSILHKAMPIEDLIN